MKPPISYYGGKIRLAPAIVNLMPPHKVYIEPFFGSGAVFFAKPPSRFEILNDVDGRVINFFRQLRNNPDHLEYLCALSPHSRDEWRESKDESPDPLEDARRFWVLINQSFAKSTRNNGWSRTFHRTQSLPGSMLTRLGRFQAAAERLYNATLENRDAIDLLDELTHLDNAVIYADPPYLATTRRQRTRGESAGYDYASEMASDDEHRRLAKTLHNTGSVVILSGYHSPLYDELYADWHTVEHRVTVNSSNHLTGDRRHATEVLWINRPVDTPATLLTLLEEA